MKTILITGGANGLALNFSAFREHKKLDLSHTSYNPENAKRLYILTSSMV